MSKVNRRVLAGVAAAGLLAPASVAVAAPAPDIHRQAMSEAMDQMIHLLREAAKPTATDLRLLKLRELHFEASDEEERAAEELGEFRGSDDPGDVAQFERWEAVRVAAFERGQAALQEMSDLRADSLMGVCIKSLQAVEATIHGASEGQVGVALSLWGDIVRMCPQLGAPRTGNAVA